MALKDAISFLYEEKATTAAGEALSCVADLDLTDEEAMILSAALVESVKNVLSGEAGRIQEACERSLARLAAAEGEDARTELLASLSVALPEKKKRKKKEEEV